MVSASHLLSALSLCSALLGGCVDLAAVHAEAERGVYQQRARGTVALVPWMQLGGASAVQRVDPTGAPVPGVAMGAPVRLVRPGAVALGAGELTIVDSGLGRVRRLVIGSSTMNALSGAPAKPGVRVQAAGDRSVYLLIPPRAGCCVSRRPASCCRPSTSRQPWSLPVDLAVSPLILSPRSCRPIYNIHIIIQAFAVVKPLITGARLLLMEYSADHQYKKDIERLINHLELSSSIIWIKPLHTEREIAGLYQAVDLSVSIPSSDSVPVSMLEAMACGVPVIASDLKSAKEWIVPDQNGILVSPNQREPVIAAVLNLLSDPDKQSHFREYNLRLIESEANQDTWMEKAENLYKELMPVHR